MAKVNSVSIQSKRGTPFVVRSALPSDAASVLELGKSVAGELEFQLSEPDEFKMTLEEEAKWLQSMLEKPGSLALAAEMDGAVVGFLDFHCGGKRRNQHTGRFGMSVARGFRDDGIGSALVQALIDWARSVDSIEKICLEVFSTNERAIFMYKKFGFQVAGRQPQHYKLGPDRYADEVQMYLMVK